MKTSRIKLFFTVNALFIVAAVFLYYINDRHGTIASFLFDFYIFIGFLFVFFTYSIKFTLPAYTLILLITTDVVRYFYFNDVNFLGGPSYAGPWVNNTIYYYGGASGASGFNCQNILRIGKINPSNPTQISWRDTIINSSVYCYRAACVSTPSGINWLGGSEITYNFNGIAYNGSGGVSATNNNIYFNTFDTTLALKPIFGINV